MTAVKLGVIDSKGEVPRFYRRISSLPHVSITTFLKQHAVLLSRGEETGDIRNVDLNEYKVQLSYQDSDDDRILICDDSDVQDAIDSVCGIPKVMAVVQWKGPQTKSTQTFIPTNETGTQPKVPDVADAFADLVNCAVASANAGISAALPPTTKVERKIQKAARTSSEALEKALEQASKQTAKAAGYAESKLSKAVKKAEKNLSRTEKKVEEALAALSKAAEAKQRSTPTPAADPSSAPEAAEQTKPTEETLFIHGRHTCDACLTTPIIGKRFHATNMPDYDLCETCHGQYKGSEITFEEAELERDIGMQNRWRRKFDLIKKHGRRPHHGRRSPPHGPQRPFGPRFHGTKPHHGPGYHRRPHSHGPPPPPHQWPPPHGPPRPFGPPPPHGPPPPVHFKVPLATPRSCELYETNGFTDNDDAAYENALNEAIRKSKEDQNMNSDSKEVMSDSIGDPSLDAAIRKSMMEVSAPTEEEVTAPGTVVDTPIDDEGFKAPSDGTSSQEEPDIDVEPAKLSEDQDALHDESRGKESVEIPVEKIPATPKILASFAAEDCNVSTAETGATIVSGKTDQSNHSSPDSAVKTSFVEQDSGSTENFLGETLDRVADAIDSLMIVDGDDEDEDEEIESQGSWSVVQEDEDLARATSMIGSALFHSDNNVGSQVSSVSSVPTTVRSIVNPAQQARWADHLERLHELGFDNDEKNVSVLEMLMAANIGVESDDEVTLEQAVNALMNRND